MNPEKLLIERVQRTYPEAKEEDILRKFEEVLRRNNLKRDLFRGDFQRKRERKRVVKEVKREIYHLLRQYDRASVQEMEDLFSQIASEYRENGFSEKCLELHLELLSRHVSTERRGNQKDFYQRMWKNIGEPKYLLDVGCGINPFSIPFMGLERPLYFGIEKKRKYVILDNKYLKLISNRLEPGSQVIEFKFTKRNVNVWPSLPYFDVALFLKVIPAMERYDKGIGNLLLQWAPAEYLILSGSVRAMIKRRKVFYREKNQILGMIKELRYEIVDKFQFPDEFVYIVRKVY